MNYPQINIYSGTFILSDRIKCSHIPIVLCTETMFLLLPPFIFPQGGKVSTTRSPLGEGWEEGSWNI